MEDQSLKCSISWILPRNCLTSSQWFFFRQNHFGHNIFALKNMWQMYVYKFNLFKLSISDCFLILLWLYIHSTRLVLHTSKQICILYTCDIYTSIKIFQMFSSIQTFPRESVDLMERDSIWLRSHFEKCLPLLILQTIFMFYMQEIEPFP